MATKIQLRRGNSTNWTNSNPLLAQGEMGVELDTYKFKIGDGINNWNLLPYASSGGTGSLTQNQLSAGFSIAGGTTSKTLTVNNSIALSGTDSSTLNIGSGGTLGTAAFTSSSSYAPSTGSTSIITVGNITSGSIGNITGGLLGSIPYQTATNATSFLSPNTTTSRKFLAQTGTGSNGNTPVWYQISLSDFASGTPSASNYLRGDGTWHQLTMSDLGTGYTTTSTFLRGDGTWQSIGTNIVDDNSTSSATEYLGMFRTNTGSVSTAYTASTKLTFVPSTGILTSPSLSITNTTASTSTGTGSLVVAGGVGIAGSVYANAFYGSGTGLSLLNASNISTGTINNSYLPTTLTGQTYNGLTNTANTIGFSIAGGTTSKTLTVNNSIGLSGTDGSTLNIGSGGTLQSFAITATTGTPTALTFLRGDGSWQPVSFSSNLVTLTNNFYTYFGF
jgi:hypothetical protein